MTENKLKSSLFNVNGKLNGSYLLANTFTGSVVKVNQNGLDAAREIFRQPQLGSNYRHDNFVNLLIENGFLIPENQDEMEVLKWKFENTKKGELGLGIAITTTTDCNFSCTYCYQRAEVAAISEAEEEKIIAYIRRNLPGKKILRIVWWGGEPLLRVAFIHRYSNILMKIAAEYDVEYQSSIVSNGFLLTKNVAEILAKCKISRIQITLDGDAKSHDCRRILKSGLGSYNKIVNNILESANYFQIVILRVNVDRRNIDDAKAVLNILEKVSKKVSVTLRPVTTPLKSGRESWMFTEQEFSDKQLDFATYAVALGYRVHFGHVDSGTTYCNAYQSSNSFGLDPGGNIQICPVYTGNNENHFGRLQKDGRVILNKASCQFAWTKSKVPFDDNNCLECLSLPICMGGCLLRENAHFRCVTKYHIAETMYLRKVSMQQHENIVSDNGI